jgi:hypothetical protein
LSGGQYDDPRAGICRVAVGKLSDLLSTAGEHEPIVPPVAAVDHRGEIIHARVNEPAPQIAHGTSHGRARSLAGPDLAQQVVDREVVVGTAGEYFQQSECV